MQKDEEMHESLLNSGLIRSIQGVLKLEISSRHKIFLIEREVSIWEESE